VSQVARALLPPLGAFLLARALLVAAASGTERPPWHAGSWSGPDSAHYLSIAREGYTLFPCSAADPPPGVCGNAGWMPLYPWLVRPLARAGMSLRWVAVLVSALFAAGTLVVLWTESLSSWPRAGLGALAAAAFFPGQVYQHGAYPLALFSLLALLCLLAARRERWLVAGLCGGAAALAYSTGWLLAPVLLAWGLASRRGARGSGAALAAALTVAGFGVVLLVQWWQLGVWNAFFRVQGAYGHGPTNPAVTWWRAVRVLFVPPWQGIQEGPHLQTLVVALWVLTVVVAGARARKGVSDAEGDTTLLLTLYTAAFWLFPLVLGTGVSLYRSEAALLPSVLLARHLPRPVLAGFVAAMALVAWPMAVLFFRLLLV
jgi:hypothetical protein